MAKAVSNDYNRFQPSVTRSGERIQVRFRRSNVKRTNEKRKQEGRLISKLFLEMKSNPCSNPGQNKATCSMTVESARREELKTSTERPTYRTFRDLISTDAFVLQKSGERDITAAWSLPSTVLLPPAQKRQRSDVPRIFTRVSALLLKRCFLFPCPNPPAAYPQFVADVHQLSWDASGVWRDPKGIRGVDFSYKREGH